MLVGTNFCCVREVVILKAESGNSPPKGYEKNGDLASPDLRCFCEHKAEMSGLRQRGV